MAITKSVLNVAVFSFGVAIGFVFCYVIFSLVLEEKGESPPDILHNDPHGRHAGGEAARGDQLAGQMDFNADAQQHN
ncbi:hypothetical protein FKM82_006968, partial [Ascaphus truei]